MAEIKLERKESVSREQAAAWLSALSVAFAGGGPVELPVGQGTMSLQVPDHVRAELEVEVNGDEIEVEIELSWSRQRPEGREA